jgi:hypothetical protein
MAMVSMLLGVAGAACGSGLRSAASYSGQRDEPVVEPVEVRESAALPAGYRVLGRVSSGCDLVRDPADYDGAWLSDVDCSSVRVETALRAAAAEVGGEMLVARDCQWSGRSDAARRSLRCTALVARAETRSLTPNAMPPSRELSPRAVWALDDPTGIHAWNLRVSFYENGSAGSRGPRRADLVSEQPTMPLGRRVLGDVRVECDHGCPLGAARAGVRVVAGRLGASDVVGTRCAREGAGWLCVATAADYRSHRRDPELR